VLREPQQFLGPGGWDHTVRASAWAGTI